MKPDRVREHFENIVGRELTSEEWAAAMLAVLSTAGGKRKRAKAMQKALHKVIALNGKDDDPKG